MNNKSKNKNLLVKGVGKVVKTVVPDSGKTTNRFKKALSFHYTRNLISKMKPDTSKPYVPFDELCERNGLDDRELQRRYFKAAWASLIFSVALIGWFVFTIMHFVEGDYLAAFRCLGTTFISFTFYFWSTVDAYCFKTRQVYSKLGFLTSFEHLLPNPYHEFSQVAEVREEGKVIRKINSFLMSKIN